MYSDEKTQTLQRMILCIELFAKVKCFWFFKPSSGRMNHYFDNSLILMKV